MFKPGFEVECEEERPQERDIEFEIIQAIRANIETNHQFYPSLLRHHPEGTLILGTEVEANTFAIFHQARWNQLPDLLHEEQLLRQNEEELLVPYDLDYDHEAPLLLGPDLTPPPSPHLSAGITPAHSPSGSQ